MILFKLFMAFFKIASFAFGGAYSFIPLMESELVLRQQWLEKAEYLEVLGVTKLFPGAISIKFATYTGYKIAGVPGVIVANIANLLPPVLFVIIASLLYSRYKELPFLKASFEMIQYAMFALIIAVAIQLVDRGQIFQLKHILVIVAAFGFFFYAKVHPAFIIIAAGVLGAVFR